MHVYHMSCDLPVASILTIDFISIREFRTQSFRTEEHWQEYPEAEPVFLYSGDRRFHEGGIEIVPVEMFLMTRYD